MAMLLEPPDWIIDESVKGPMSGLGYHHFDGAWPLVACCVTGNSDLRHVLELAQLPAMPTTGPALDIVQQRRNLCIPLWWCQ
jgi:hypothetical protein